MNIEINCCLLALAFAIINVLQLVCFFRYSLTLRKEMARLDSDKNKDHIELQKEMARFESDKNKDRIEFQKEMARIASETKTTEMVIELCKKLEKTKINRSDLRTSKHAH